jgi:hypothetical protein
MSMILYIKGNNQEKVYSFKLDRRNVNSYFHKALKFLYQNNGIVFVKYKKQHNSSIVYSVTVPHFLPPLRQIVFKILILSCKIFSRSRLKSLYEIISFDDITKILSSLIEEIFSKGITRKAL